MQATPKTTNSIWHQLLEISVCSSSWDVVSTRTVELIYFLPESFMNLYSFSNDIITFYTLLHHPSISKLDHDIFFKIHGKTNLKKIVAPLELQTCSDIYHHKCKKKKEKLEIMTHSMQQVNYF